MEIILKVDVKGVGYKNDVVKVRDGYGRNYLIPQGVAIEATSSAKKQVAENLKQAAHKAARIKQDAEQLAEQLANITFEIKAKVSETGKIFGSVTTIQVADALKEKGFNIDRRKMSFVENEIKTLGNYHVEIDLHREVKQKVPFTVVPAN
ncbi:MAG: 50S ribosomal protein L9 [Cytophagales bacterium]|nr:MAG: 50S ribosomal protein L9 [Cytophagales bacterium]